MYPGIVKRTNISICNADIRYCLFYLELLVHIYFRKGVLFSYYSVEYYKYFILLIEIYNSNVKFSVDLSSGLNPYQEIYINSNNVEYIKTLNMYFSAACNMHVEIPAGLPDWNTSVWLSENRRVKGQFLI